MRYGTVNEVRPGMYVADTDRPDKRRQVKRVDPFRCRNHVHLDDLCYDSGAHIWIVEA